MVSERIVKPSLQVTSLACLHLWTSRKQEDPVNWRDLLENCQPAVCTYLFILFFFLSLSQESRRCFLVTGPAQTEVWSDLFQNSKTGTWYVMQCTTHCRKSDADKDMLWGFCKHSSCNKTTKSAKNIKSCLPLHSHHVFSCPTVCFVLQLYMNIDI